MSGGIAYVYDEHGDFAGLCNTAMVDLEKVLPAARQPAGEPRHMNADDETLLRSLIERHAAYTGSERAKQLIAQWETQREKFVKVYPKEYRRALTDMQKSERKEAA
jgi:glutamate synthase (NADPH/NADH) large chain